MGWFWTSQAQKPIANRWDLSTPLLTLSRQDVWTIGDACLGTLVTGATGAGKTTGPGAAIVLALLRAKCGGLVLAAKRGERQSWEEYCRLTGRIDDLVIFDASGRHRFSFLDEELQRAGAGAGLTENIVNLLSTCLEITQRNGGQSGREDEGYWKQAQKQLVRNAVDLLVMSKGRVTVPDLYRAVVSAPTSREQLASDEWKRGSFCFQCLREADAAPKSSRAARDFELVADYFMCEFPGLSDRTRSVIVSTFTSMVDVLNRSLFRDLFSDGTTIRPEDTLEGKIILVDLPVKEFAEAGAFAAVLWKYCWQRAVERRDVVANPRPVFLFADEFQHFSVSYDQIFQTTARSSRAMTVYLTQNIPNLLAAFGGAQAKAMTDSLVGNLNTKIWTCNGDPETNQWAASVIGRSRQLFMNSSKSQAGIDWLALAGLAESGPTTAGFSEQMDFDVDPQTFTVLRTGGPPKWEVDSIVFQGGRQFQANHATWLPVTFRQHL
ncbi:MAG: TraM recognition domain-containing protein [Planctomycetaceae bacterium]|nr:TraM recognition domain-containing protein [Planctomycetaceae bacterium]